MSGPQAIRIATRGSLHLRIKGHLWHPVPFQHESVFEPDLNISEALVADAIIGIRIG